MFDFKESGRCHICAEQKPIKFCDLCGHYLCLYCYLSPERAVAAVETFLFGNSEHCCGPNALERSN